MTGYKWKPPIAREGDDVMFVTHRGHYLGGVIRRIETTYSDALVARHTYRIQMSHRRTCEWHGEDSIKAVNGAPARAINAA